MKNKSFKNEITTMSQTNTNREQKIRSILERSSNIDVDTLQKYIDKKLTKEQLHEVEKQLLNSDFAAEAAEGYANADFKVNIAASTHQLNKEIKKYNKERGFYKQDYRVWYAAASVALIFVVLFGLIKGTGFSFERDEFTEQDAADISTQNENVIEENDLALNQEDLDFEKVEKELIQQLKEEKIEYAKKENKASSSKVEARNMIKEGTSVSRNSTNEQDFSTSDIWISKREKIDNANEDVAASPTLPTHLQDSSPQLNNNQLADDDYNYFSKADTELKKKRNQKSPKEILFDAMQAYENKKYTEANLLFDSYLTTNPNDAQALYFGGISYYENHNYKKTIPLLEKFLTQKSSIVYQKNSQDAEWYLANSYLKENENRKAKTLLEKIVETKGKYASQAKQLLNKL